MKGDITGAPEPIRLLPLPFALATAVSGREGLLSPPLHVGVAHGVPIEGARSSLV